MENALRTLEDVPLKGLNLRLEKVGIFGIYGVLFGTLGLYHVGLKILCS